MVIRNLNSETVSIWVAFGPQRQEESPAMPSSILQCQSSSTKLFTKAIALFAIPISMKLLSADHSKCDTTSMKV